MHGDHIHITLTEDNIIFSRSARFIQPVQVAALIKYPGFRRIQVFWFPVAHNPASEADHPVVHIHNRKNNPVPELVIHSMTLVNIEKSGISQSFVTVFFCFQIPVQSAAVFVGIAEPEFADSVIRESSSCQVLISCSAFFCTKLIIIILGSFFIYSEKLLFLLCFLFYFSGIFDSGKFHPGSVRKVFQCFSEGKILIFHNKIKYIPASSASEAVIHLLSGRDRERWGFLIMERAESEIGTPLPCKLHILGYYIYNVIPAAHFFNDIVRITHKQSTSV